MNTSTERRLPRPLCCTLATLIALSTSGWIVPGAAQESADSSRIAFYSDRDGNTEIYIMKPDGSEQKRLTHNNAEDRDPVWSPDGRRIAFTSHRDGNQELYVMDADGTHQRRLTSHRGADHSPAWSPDGQRIAFVSDRDVNNEIYLVRADGTGLQNLTRHAAEDVRPAWSADGKRISFISSRDNPASHDDSGEIYVINLTDGSTSRPVDKRRAVGVRWSPVDDRLAYFAVANRRSEVFVMNADGTGETNLSKPVEGRSDIDPVWSPDGTYLAFHGDRENLGVPGVYVSHADGSAARRISRPSDVTLGPISWSPDGSRLTYSVFERGNWEIYSVARDRSDHRVLTVNTSMDLGATWAPAVKASRTMTRR